MYATLICCPAWSKPVIMPSLMKRAIFSTSNHPDHNYIMTLGLRLMTLCFPKLAPSHIPWLLSNPPIPKDLLHLPKFTIPHKCCQWHLPLWVTATPPHSAPCGCCCCSNFCPPNTFQHCLLFWHQLQRHDHDLHVAWSIFWQISQTDRLAKGQSYWTIYSRT